MSTDWLARLKSLDSPEWFSESPSITESIPTMERASRLVDVITVHGDDATIYALLELLAGVSKLFTKGSAEDRHRVEMMLEVAIARAYAQTSHFRKSRDECLVNSVRCASWREVKPVSRLKGKGK